YFASYYFTFGTQEICRLVKRLDCYRQNQFLRFAVTIRGRYIDCDLRCSLREILLLIALTDVPPRAEYDQNCKDCNRCNWSPNGNTPHRRMKWCVRCRMSILRSRRLSI